MLQYKKSNQEVELTDGLDKIIVAQIEHRISSGLEVKFDQIQEVWKELILDRKISPEMNHLYLLSQDYRLIKCVKDDYGKLHSLNISEEVNLEDLLDVDEDKIFASKDLNVLSQNKNLTEVKEYNLFSQLAEYQGKVYEGALNIEELEDYLGLRFGGQYGDCYSFDAYVNSKMKRSGFFTDLPQLGDTLNARGKKYKIVQIQHEKFIVGEDWLCPSSEPVFRQKLRIDLI